MACAQATAAASAFVTVTAKVSIAIGIVATLYAATQVVAALVLLGQVDTDAVLGFLAMHAVPAPVIWVLTHLTSISVGMLAVSGAFLAVSVGLLRRRAWGWWGFVVFMVIGAAANFAGIAAIDAMFGWVQALPATPQTAPLQASFGGLRVASLAMLWGTALVFAVLHGLIVWQLCKSDVRAEFGMFRPPR